MTTWHLQQACRHLHKGNIIAYPTEAVYGLGCNPLNIRTIQRLLRVKHRVWQKGLILIASDFSQLQPFLQPLSRTLQAQVFATWPGPVTWLLPAKPDVSHWLRGQSLQLAVRVTAHPLASALCQAWGGALVSTSANCSGRPAAKTTLQVRQSLLHSVDYIVPGAVGKRQRPSEIRDGLTNQVIRV